MRALSFVLLLCFPLAAAQAQAPQRVAPADRATVQQSFSPVVKRVAPAVVNVYASRVERQARNPLFDDPVFRQFFGGGEQQRSPTTQSLGSGVIVDPSGLVVTNHHVIENMTDVKVALADKREYEAEIILRDPRTDLAGAVPRSSWAIPTRLRSAIWCWRSAIRLAWGRR